MGGNVNNVMRNALTQLAGSLTNETFTAIVAACNLPKWHGDRSVTSA